MKSFWVEEIEEQRRDGAERGAEQWFFSVTLQEWLCPLLSPAESGTWHSRALVAKTGWRGNGNGAGAIKGKVPGRVGLLPKERCAIGHFGACKKMRATQREDALSHPGEAPGAVDSMKFQLIP